jgi:hypothetical protein
MTRPLQVFIDEEDLLRLEAWTRKRGWTKSQAVRAAVRLLTRAPDRDPILRASGMIEGLPADLSSAFDRYLEETFVVKKRAPRRRPRG